MTERWIDRVGVRLDREADVALGTQLAWGLSGAIRSGALAPGDRLPPLRTLAAELGVNLNTLRAVYVRLEAAGLIETRHGSGTFVTDAAAARDLDGLVATAARAARDAGVEPRELAAALYVAPPTTPARDPDAARRRALREEIAVLERVLSSLRARPAPPAGRSRGGGSLLTVAELEATHAELVARIGAATHPPEPEPEPAPKAARAPQRTPAKARPKPRLGPATA